MDKWYTETILRGSGGGGRGVNRHDSDLTKLVNLFIFGWHQLSVHCNCVVHNQILSSVNQIALFPQKRNTEMKSSEKVDFLQSPVSLTQIQICHIYVSQYEHRIKYIPLLGTFNLSQICCGFRQFLWLSWTFFFLSSISDRTIKTYCQCTVCSCQAECFPVQDYLASRSIGKFSNLIPHKKTKFPFQI